MKKLTQIAGSFLLVGALLGSSVPVASAQDWRQERRERRQARRVQRTIVGGILGTIAGLDRNRQVRYRYDGGRRMTGYYDRYGRFHAMGYYDRNGNFWQYR